MATAKEILFRGKAINRVEGREYRTNYKNGDWVYGLVTNHYIHSILPATMRNEDGISGIEVDYETIGQYTGLKDKSGKRVFEGDILLISGIAKSVAGVVGFGGYIDADSGVSDDYPCIGFYLKFIDEGCCNIGAILNDSLEYRVIGNIFDNPELLEGDKT